MIRLRQGCAGSFIDLSEITYRPHAPRHLAREVVLVVARDDVADRERDVLVLVDADPVLRRGYMVLTGYSGSERTKQNNRAQQTPTAEQTKVNSGATQSHVGADQKDGAFAPRRPRWLRMRSSCRSRTGRGSVQSGIDRIHAMIRTTTTAETPRDAQRSRASASK
jgi:hypothetical protein